MLASAQRTEPLAQASLIGNSATELPGTYAVWVNQGTKMSVNFSETHQFNKSFRKQNALICELSTQRVGFELLSSCKFNNNLVFNSDCIPLAFLVCRLYKFHLNKHKKTNLLAWIFFL